MLRQIHFRQLFTGRYKRCRCLLHGELSESNAAWCLTNIESFKVWGQYFRQGLDRGCNEVEASRLRERLFSGPWVNSGTFNYIVLTVVYSVHTVYIEVEIGISCNISEMILNHCSPSMQLSAVYCSGQPQTGALTDISHDSGIKDFRYKYIMASSHIILIVGTMKNSRRFAKEKRKGYISSSFL